MFMISESVDKSRQSPGQGKELLFHSVQVHDPMFSPSQKMRFLFAFPSKKFKINELVEKNPCLFLLLRNLLLSTEYKEKTDD